jgi:hypothetical protein
MTDEKIKRLLEQRAQAVGCAQQGVAAFAPRRRRSADRR